MAWYLTKYALSMGIIEVPDSEIEIKEKWVHWKRPGHPLQLFCPGVEAHDSAEAAVRAATAMAKKKIKANQKSTQKMEALVKEWEGK